MIEVQRITREFGRFRALDQVSFRIAAGERVGFFGESGSGKTTLLRAMMGLERVTGRITLRGEDCTQRLDVALNNICYLPQTAPALDAPVIEIIRAVTLMQALPARVIYEKAEALGLLLQKCERTRFQELSIAMKKKLLAAIALSAKSPILLCDEPLSDLDGPARAAFLVQLRALPSARTVIFCARAREDLHELVSRTMELCGGRVVRDELVSDEAVAPLVVAEPYFGLSAAFGTACPTSAVYS